MNHSHSPQLRTEMYQVEGNYAVHFRAWVDSGASSWQSDAAIRAYGRRPGLDEEVTAPYQPLCVRCRRRGATHEATNMCHTCYIGWGYECSPAEHVRSVMWTSERGVPGMNCHSCNRWLPALGDVEATPASIEPRERVVPADIELGFQPTQAFRWFLQRVLPVHAPDTAELLLARINDTRDSIRAGDANVLYTAIIHAEYLFNSIARRPGAVVFTTAQRSRFGNLLRAIRRIARALVASRASAGYASA